MDNPIADGLMDIHLERHGVGDEEKQFMVITGKVKNLGLVDTRIEIESALLDIGVEESDGFYEGGGRKEFVASLTMKSRNIVVDKIDGVPQADPKEPEVRQSVFQPVKHRQVKGWKYPGGEPDDATILELAKHGVLITYYSTEDNDWDGEYVRVTANGEKKDFDPGTWIVFQTWNDGQWQFDNCNHRWEYDAPVAPERETRNVGEVTLKEALDMIADAP